VHLYPVKTAGPIRYSCRYGGGTATNSREILTIGLNMVRVRLGLALGVRVGIRVRDPYKQPHNLIIQTHTNARCYFS